MGRVNYLQERNFCTAEDYGYKEERMMGRVCKGEDDGKSTELATDRLVSENRKSASSHVRTLLLRVNF